MQVGKPFLNDGKALTFIDDRIFVLDFPGGITPYTIVLNGDMKVIALLPDLNLKMTGCCFL